MAPGKMNHDMTGYVNATQNGSSIIAAEPDVAFLLLISLIGYLVKVINLTNSFFNSNGEVESHSYLLRMSSSILPALVSNDYSLGILKTTMLVHCQWLSIQSNE